MDERLRDIRSKKNSKARIKIMEGHFATSHSHISTYIDMSTVKSRHNNARETARVLAEEYLHNTTVDTIVCLEETVAIGTFLAEHLSDGSQLSFSKGNNISVITPEYHQSGQILFRDNVQRMVKGFQVLVLAPSVTTGKSVNKAVEAIEYYGGTVCGICAVFSSVDEIHGIKVKSIFSNEDVPNYRAYTPEECPMCKEGKRLEAMVNSYGYSKL